MRIGSLFGKYVINVPLFLAPQHVRCPMLRLRRRRREKKKESQTSAFWAKIRQSNDSDEDGRITMSITNLNGLSMEYKAALM